MRTRMFIPLLMCAMTSLSGCVMLPIPTGESKVLEGKQVTREQLAFLTPNVTTKEEVIDNLGSPNVIWEDVHVFAYNWVVRRGILLWGAGGGAGAGSAAAGIADLPKGYVLLIQFDEHDRVRRFERSVRPAFKSYGNFLKEWVRNSDNLSPQGPNDRKD